MFIENVNLYKLDPSETIFFLWMTNKSSYNYLLSKFYVGNGALLQCICRLHHIDNEYHLFQNKVVITQF